MLQIEAEAGANVRTIWTPNAANCFKRMSAGQLDALFMSLFDLEADSSKYKTFVKTKKSAKAVVLDTLFNDPEQDKVNDVTKDQLALIDAWVPVLS